MGKLAWTCLLVFVATGSVKALLDLTGLWVANGTWKAAITLPCLYEPSADFKELSVAWKASRDARKTIFHRDANSGDQVLLTAFKGRLSVAKAPPGNVSLLIHKLEMTDTGKYTCEVSWEARNKSWIKRERTTTLKVVKVPVSKPIIASSSNGSVLPTGRKTSLTCLASGSPAITYQWFKELPGSNDKRLGGNAVLTFDRLQTSDSGRYYCTAENTVSPQREQSDLIQLTVQESLTLQPESKVPTSTGTGTHTCTPPEETTTAQWERKGSTVVGPVNPGKVADTQKGSRRASLPLYIIILIAVLCAALLIVVGSVIFCRRRATKSDNLQVTYTNYAMTRGETIPASLGIVPVCGFEYEEPNRIVGNKYTMEPTKGGEYVTMGANTDNEYEFLPNKMESEYEIGG